MTLAFDAKRLFVNASGLGNYSRTLVGNLVANYPEHRYTLFTPRIDAAYRRLAFVEPQGANAASVATRHYAGPLGGLWRAFGIARELEPAGVDLYHGLSHELPYGIHRTGVKSVVTIHDLIYQHFPEQFAWVDRRVFDWKFGYAIRHADHVVAITEHTRRDILARYPEVAPERVSVVYQSCDPLFFEQPACATDVTAKFYLPTEYVLSVGSIVERKNLEVVLKALAQLPPPERLPLVAIGRGRVYRERLREVARAHNVADYLHVVDTLADTTELIEVYRRARAFVYPSRYEGFGIPVVESQLCGTPVLAGDVPALREAGGEGAWYADPDDVPAWTQLLRRVLTDDAAAQRLAEAGRAQARARFDGAVLSAELHAVYERVLSGP